ncbi:MAG: electron transport complex subunit E [Bacteroidales bacterium]|jgi:electron transport complex protein RnfE|nr:electron transport complex subunit E [Bacteroidales bacterium]
MSHWKTFSNGILKENPAFVLVLGMCPTLATTTSAINGLGMGLATTFVLMLSNVAISLVAGFVPDKVRIPAYIVIIASFVTIVDMLMSAYVNSPGPNGEQSLYDQLGIFIPLIVVNCIVLGRAEAFAAKNNAFMSFLDGAGMGLGFTGALTLLGAIREFLGNGSVFGLQLLPSTTNILIFVLAPGAFIVLGFLIALVNRIKKV